MLTTCGSWQWPQWRARWAAPSTRIAVDPAGSLSWRPASIRSVTGRRYDLGVKTPASESL